VERNHAEAVRLYMARSYTVDLSACFTVSLGISNGGHQFLSNRWSNRHIVPLYSKSDRLLTRVFRFEER